MKNNNVKKNIIEIRDFYNPNKIWVIKRDSSRHYFYTQKIKGQQLNKYEKTTLKFLNSLFEKNEDALNKLKALLTDESVMG